MSEVTSKMKTLTVGGVKFSVVDEETQAEMLSTIGMLDDLATSDKTSLVSAINELYKNTGGGGPGGGGTNNAIMTLKNDTGWLYKNIAQNTKCDLKMSWSSLEDGVSTGPGALTVKVGGILRYSTSVDQGNVVVDVSPYLSAGSNSIRVSVSDIYGNSKTLAFTINCIVLTLTSSFDDAVEYTGEIVFPYVPTGAVEKKVYFILDGSEIGYYTTSESGRQQSFTIPAQTHGSHSLHVYFTANIDGEDITSNGLYYDIICKENGVNTPIISSTFRDTDAEQYIPISISYRVYDPLGLTTAVSLKANGTEVNALTVDRTKRTWSYRPDEYGELNLTIEATGANGEVATKNFKIAVKESDIDVSATTNNLELYLTAYGRSNSESNPSVWSNNGIDVELTGFNFASDGWQMDEDHNTVLRLAGDARAYIPLNIFGADFRTTGKTIEIEFASRDVRNYDATLISCMSGGRGLEITAQRATMTSEQSTIGTQYKEEEHVRLSFVVEKRSANKLLMCYINGILSGVVNYPDGDDFSQQTPVGISIGSSECTTDIYCIRVYNADLTRYQILDNWIADTQVGAERRARYERNRVYDEYGAITPDTLKKDLPYLILTAAALPQFKGDKKTCDGEYVDPVNPGNSFEFENAEIDVQGTSSQYYYVKNYKIKFKGGFILWDGNKAEVYQLNEDAVPTDTYTFKADVASSEGANNVLLARLYNDLCPVKTPPQEENPLVRQTIDGHPIVIFWNDGTGTKFIGKYNFNHDKGTEEVFGFSEGDESWEILQNGTERVGFRSADFSGDDWKNDFEGRYPDKNTNITNLKAFAEWVVSTNTAAATNAALNPAVEYDGVSYTTDSAAYRLAKFKAELPDHANVDALVFYYVFTDLFLCIDQREKNAFPTLFADDPHWLMLFYDADSSLGTDNKGNLAFDYYLEDIDYTEAGDPIFNGQASVLWVNLRNAFYDKITAEYTRLRTTMRSDGSGNPLLSYDVVNDLFESHQGKWSEAIYNEDGYRKSLEPFILKGDDEYLPMLQGKKEQQRKWWLYNRFRYKDSQFVTGSSMETRIRIRAHAKGNLTLTSYVNMYGHVYYNAEMVEHRMFRGEPQEFIWAATGAEDAVIGINDADMLTSLGDLAPLMVEDADISKATHLTELKIGDASSSYVNRNLTSITLGNNILLKTLDLRNCVNLTQAVNASGCANIEEVYLDNTAVTGISLPNGGILKTLHLPATVTNLTLLNQTKLEDFVLPNPAGVTTLRLENNSDLVDPLAIFNAMAQNGRVRIMGFDWTMTDSEFGAFISKLDSMRGLDENGNNTDMAQVSGRIYVPEINGSTLNNAKKYVGLTVEYGSMYLNSTRLVERTLSGMYVNDRVTSIGAMALRECTKITGVKFVNAVSVSAESFLNSGVRDVDLPEATSLIGNVFSSGLPTTANFPKVTSIGNRCFTQPGTKILCFPALKDLNGEVFYQDTGAMQVLDLHAITSFGCYSVVRGEWKCPALVIRTNTVASQHMSFSGGILTTGTGYIYVPRALVDSYKAATNWSAVASQFRALEDYTLDGTIMGELDYAKMGVSI